MRNRPRRSEREVPFDVLTELGDKLRAEYGDVRYADYILYFNGQWTRTATWECYVNGVWIKIDLPLENY